MTGTPRKGTLGREARLKGSEMERIFASGRKTVRGDLILWAAASPSPGGPRLGLSVSRKVGGAARRNRLKRLIREAFRLNRVKLRAGMDLIFYPRPGCRWVGLADAERALLDACLRAGVLSR